MDMTQIVVLLVSALVAVYTFNYCRWAWRSGNQKGALGLLLLAAASLVIPGYMLLRQG